MGRKLYISLLKYFTHIQFLNTNNILRVLCNLIKVHQIYCHIFSRIDQKDWTACRTLSLSPESLNWLSSLHWSVHPIHVRALLAHVRALFVLLTNWCSICVSVRYATRSLWAESVSTHCLSRHICQLKPMSELELEMEMELEMESELKLKLSFVCHLPWCALNAAQFVLMHDDFPGFPVSQSHTKQQQQLQRSHATSSGWDWPCPWETLSPSLIVICCRCRCCSSCCCYLCCCCCCCLALTNAKYQFVLWAQWQCRTSLLKLE